MSIGLPWVGLVLKNLPAKAGHLGSIPESGRSPGEGNGNPLLGNILWPEEPEGLLNSMGLQKVRHDLETK